MKGWMKYKNKGGRLGSFRTEYHHWFMLTNAGELVGYKDEESVAFGKPEVSLDICKTAITISQDSTNQFEIIGDKYHFLFTVDAADDTLSWVSSIQLQRSINQGASPAPNKVVSKGNVSHDKIERDRSSSSNSVNSMSIKRTTTPRAINGQPVFDDPLNRSTSPVGNQDFEWDNEAVTSPSASVWAPPEEEEETSAVFQLTQELANTKAELLQSRQRIQSYQEVLASRDRQLFEIQDQKYSDDHQTIRSDAFRDLEEQARSYRDQNALLNEEVLKLHQMYNKMQAEAAKQTKRADQLSTELRNYQRDYLAALGSCIYRPLVEPDEGVRFEIPERERHIENVKSLIRRMKTINHRILGCSVPNLGKSEHVDAFGFVHSLPSQPLQLQYVCNYLEEAYNVLMEMEGETQKDSKKWKNYILDSSEQFEVTPQLRKLVLQGIPAQYRAYLWQKLIHYYVADMKQECGNNYYNIILSQLDLLKEDKKFAKNLKQISMDVPRTMPNNKDFAIADSQHKERLQHVLAAFCVHSPKVEYCQGFNFLAGGCLLFLEEEDAFWFLVAIAEKLFPPDYYRNGLAGLLADQYVLQDIIAQTLPRLHDFLTRYPEVDLAAVTMGWFLGLFFDCLPFQTLIRVWDCFLAFGHEAVFRVACAMFRIFESRLLELNESSQILHAAKNIPKLCLHPAQLIKEAFEGPFPPWEEVEELRTQIELDMVKKHEKKVEQRRYYDERLMLLDQYEENLLQEAAENRWIFDCGAANEKFILSANCRATQSSRLYEVCHDHVKNLSLPITNRVMCVYVINDDVVLVGLFTGQLQAYSCGESSLCWSMSLSDVVLCILSCDNVTYVGTADGKLHFLQFDDLELATLYRRKPMLTDSIELSKRPTTAVCHIEDQGCLWVASGPAIYVVSTETNETDGFFLISSRIEQVSCMLHWSSYVLIAVRGYSVLQLHGTEAFNNPPLLVYDVSKGIPLSPLHPMMPDEDSTETPSFCRVTSMTLVSENDFWVGLANGDIKMYRLENKDNEDASASSVSESKVYFQSTTNPLSLRFLGSKSGSEKSIRCLLKSNAQVVSCSGCYGDEGSVKMWNFNGEFTNVETPASRSSSSDILEDSRSLASSSKSLESDARQVAIPPAPTDAWKSAVKSAAATAMKTYRDKKPTVRKLMNILGTNQSTAV